MPCAFLAVSPSGNMAHDCVQYQDQDIDIGGVHRPSSHFTNFVCVAMWLFCNHHHNRDTELFHHRSGPPCYPFIATPISSPPFPNPCRQPQICDLVISRIFYK